MEFRISEKSSRKKVTAGFRFALSAEMLIDFQDLCLYGPRNSTEKKIHEAISSYELVFPWYIHGTPKKAHQLDVDVFKWCLKG